MFRPKMFGTLVAEATVFGITNKIKEAFISRGQSPHSLYINFVLISVLNVQKLLINWSLYIQDVIIHVHDIIKDKNANDPEVYLDKAWLMKKI